MSTPPDAPPSYAQATGSSTTTTARPTHLEVPQAQNDIPVASRRSMEDELRPLPEGWIRQFDAKEQHQFFVNTKTDPPRSIWCHPYDDDEYLSTLSSEERERIQEEERKLKRPVTPSTEDGEHEWPPLPARPERRTSSGAAGPGPATTAAAATAAGSAGRTGKKSFGEKMKDRLTGTTHEERVRDRARRADEEREYYAAHLRFREAMRKAQMTGQPQFFGQDRDGRDIYIEPPSGPGPYGGGYGRNAYGYNPYSEGPYTNPNARFIRPQYQYGRPGGGYYGGGIGLPLVGGLVGGALLGGLLF